MRFCTAAAILANQTLADAERDSISRALADVKSHLASIRFLAPVEVALVPVEQAPKEAETSADFGVPHQDRDQCARVQSRLPRCRSSYRGQEASLKPNTSCQVKYIFIKILSMPPHSFCNRIDHRSTELPRHQVSNACHLPTRQIELRIRCWLAV